MERVKKGYVDALKENWFDLVQNMDNSLTDMSLGSSKFQFISFFKKWPIKMESTSRKKHVPSCLLYQASLTRKRPH